MGFVVMWCIVCGLIVLDTVLTCRFLGSEMECSVQVSSFVLFWYENHCGNRICCLSTYMSHIMKIRWELNNR